MDLINWEIYSGIANKVLRVLYLQKVHGKPPERQEYDRDDRHANQCLLIFTLVERSCRDKGARTRMS